MENLLLIFLLLFVTTRISCSFSLLTPSIPRRTHRHVVALSGWVQRDGGDGEWEWEEDDPNYVAPVAATTTTGVHVTATATPQLPSRTYKPKQSLGQNYLKDPNTVAKIVRAFHTDATKDTDNNNYNDNNSISEMSVVELGPGAGALTETLVAAYGYDVLQCIEIDDRSVEILLDRHPNLRIRHEDVLQVDYSDMANEAGRPLNVIGNLPYYITSQILFAFADAAHAGAISSATVTMQWEVAKRMVASPSSSKDYGILSVVFQIYCTDVDLHFKIPPTVFYPKPKVDSALVGLHFLSPPQLRQRLGGVLPANLRRVVTTAFQQRRKTMRNSLKKLCREICNGDTEAAQALLSSSPLPLPAIVVKAQEEGDAFAKTQELPKDWASKRPEELAPAQFIELTRRLYNGSMTNAEAECDDYPLGNKVWRKLKHGRG